MTGPEAGRRRREPRQRRSRATVERIVSAARSELVLRGYDGVTTNHIAAAAGISPGSLYQYFPDKEAILGEVVERHTDDLEARVSRAFLAVLSDADSAQAARRAGAALVDALAEGPDLLRVVVERFPRSTGSRRAIFARRIDELLTGALAARFGDRLGRAPEAVAWVLVRAVENVTISYVLEGPPIDREALVDELGILVLGVLGIPDRPGWAHRPR